MQIGQTETQAPSEAMGATCASHAEPQSAGWKVYYSILGIALIAMLIPIWTVDYPGMVDYPNHLARCYVLAHYHDIPLWGQRYFLVHDPIPNLAIDLIVAPLLRWLPLIVCGKIFLTLAAALYVVGCSEVGRAATGKLNWLVLPVVFTFYNSPLLYGFVNYVFGVGVFLCVFAYWLRVHQSMSGWRFLFCCLLSLAAFFSHLSAVVFLGVGCCTVAFLEFFPDRKLSRLAVQLAWLFCPLLIVVLFLKRSGQIGTIAWSTLHEKLLHLLAPVRSYSLTLDLIVIAGLALCAVPLLKGSKIHRTALVGLVFFALYLITPNQLLTYSAADARYVVPAWVLLVVSVEPSPGRWRKAALALALILMLVRTGSIDWNWRAIDRRNEQVLAMGSVLPEGARVYALPLPENTPKPDRGFFHIIQLWTVSREADIPSLFALPGQQPLVFRQPPCVGPEWAKCFAHYNYVWAYDPPEPIRQDLLRVATPAATWEKITLWQVRP